MGGKFEPNSTEWNKLLAAHNVMVRIDEAVRIYRLHLSNAGNVTGGNYAAIAASQINAIRAEYRNPSQHDAMGGGPDDLLTAPLLKNWVEGLRKNGYLPPDTPDFSRN